MSICVYVQLACLLLIMKMVDAGMYIGFENSLKH